MVPPIHLGAWSMALMLWLPFELLRASAASELPSRLNAPIVLYKIISGEYRDGPSLYVCIYNCYRKVRVNVRAVYTRGPGRGRSPSLVCENDRGNILYARMLTIL